MPTKPDKSIINACKARLNPKDVLRVVIAETPELRQAAIDTGVVNEIKEQ